MKIRGKQNHLSDAEHNEGKLWVIKNTDRERTELENKLRGYNDKGSKVDLVVGVEGSVWNRDPTGGHEKVVM